ncbi:helix-turn-helix domain-containing protein [Actinomadura violacea]|uniref:Helix-turn-helix domain-containing protein n=1 Tax=Actinomadura violacea TaxID=2819934 RepID=A0ABS3RVB5_9ACTN|nr:helix-turn-helix transcriptional regulator [Actinomadura violacea]MBO2460702.1 helix-turn-helix domain-containing protein [Actinomadura violacea]
MGVPSRPGPVVQRAVLTSELQRLRQENDTTQEQVAAALDWSTSKLIRIEGGAVGVSTTDLHALLRHYGIQDGDAQIAKLTEIARDARQRGWWALYKNELAPEYLRYIGYENGASIIRSFQPLLVPGLLQTEEYANAVTVEFVPTLNQRDVVVEVRMRRQEEIFSQSGPPRISMVVDEAALRRRVGGQVDPGIMPRQLRHLLGMLEKPYVSIEVIPFSKGAHFGMGGEFTVLEFADARVNDVLYIEQTDVTVMDPDARITGYRAAYENLRQLAVRPDETGRFIEEIIASMT